MPGVSTRWTRRIPFKVDVAGVIRIMGQSLYSRPTAAVRELLQNGHDAVARRRTTDLAYRGRLDLVQDAAAGTLTVADDGVGLTEAEAEQYLGTLGIGITGLLRRDAGPAADSAALIGQFGVGLFSGFLLADRIVVQTRRADGSRRSGGRPAPAPTSSCRPATGPTPARPSPSTCGPSTWPWPATRRPWPRPSRSTPTSCPSPSSSTAARPAPT